MVEARCITVAPPALSTGSCIARRVSAIGGAPSQGQACSVVQALLAIPLALVQKRRNIRANDNALPGGCRITSLRRGCRTIKFVVAALAVKDASACLRGACHIHAQVPFLPSCYIHHAEGRPASGVRAKRPHWQVGLERAEPCVPSLSALHVPASGRAPLQARPIHVLKRCFIRGRVVIRVIMPLAATAWTGQSPSDWGCHASTSLRPAG